MGLFALALAVRVAFLAISDQDDFDAVLRLALSRVVVDHGVWSPADFWLPGHLWLLAIPYRLGLAAPVWARLLGALAGAATAPAVAGLARRWGASAAAACAAGVLIALDPLHVRVSVLTVAEPFFLFFATVALWLFTVWLDGGALLPLVGGTLAATFASTQRIEGWALVALLPLVTLLRRRGDGAWRRTAAFVTWAAIFPAAWALHLWYAHGDPLYVVHFNAARLAASRTQDAAPVEGWSIVAWPLILLAALGPVAWPAVRAVARSFRVDGGRAAGALFAVALIAVMVLAASGRIEPTARYGVVLVWLLVIAAATAAGGVLVRPDVAAALAGVWLVGAAVVPALGAVSPRPLFAADIRAVDAWLRARPDSGTLVLGPMRGDEWRWSAELADWRPRGSARAVTSAGQAATVIASAPRGLWVVERDALGADAAALAGGRVVPAWSAGRYAVYRW